MVARAMADSMFFNLLPEFIPLQAKMRAAKTLPSPHRGCGACHQRRLAVNVYQDFVYTLAILGDDAQRRMKQYFNVPALMFNARDAVSGRVALKVI
jgi:hypothetical protein